MSGIANDGSYKSVRARTSERRQKGVLFTKMVTNVVHATVTSKGERVLRSVKVPKAPLPPKAFKEPKEGPSKEMKRALALVDNNRRGGKLSYAEAAARCGVSQGSISNWKNGNVTSSQRGRK
jgi:hypothetical protein